MLKIPLSCQQRKFKHFSQSNFRRNYNLLCYELKKKKNKNYGLQSTCDTCEHKHFRERTHISRNYASSSAVMAAKIPENLPDWMPGD